MRDLGTTLLLYSLRLGSACVEPIPNSNGRDYAGLKELLKKHVIRIENESNCSNDEAWTAPDSACLARPASPASFAKENRRHEESTMRGILPASSVISLARTLLRTLERSSELPTDSPALQKLREAVNEIALELEPAAKKEPKFVLRTGADLYSQKAG